MDSIGHRFHLSGTIEDIGMTCSNYCDGKLHVLTDKSICSIAAMDTWCWNKVMSKI